MKLLYILILFILTGSFVYAEVEMEERLTNQYATRFWNSFNTDLSSETLDVYIDNWDENAERITPTVHARGRTAIREIYQRYLLTYRDFHQQEVRRIVEGNVAVSELLTTAVRRSDGSKLVLPNVAIVEFNSAGRVIRARVYLDTAKFKVP